MTENLTNNQTEATGSIMDGIDPEKTETLEDINSPDEKILDRGRPENLGDDFWNDEKVMQMDFFEVVEQHDLVDAVEKLGPEGTLHRHQHHLFPLRFSG